MFDVVALGELLIDFTPSGKGDMGNPAFEMNPGGAPANCLAAVTAFGGKTAFIGKVGRDTFGEFLKKTLGNAGIETKGLRYAEDVHTTLAFVHLDDRGDRSFDFFRNPGADIMITKEDIDLSLIDDTKILHFGSLSLTHSPARETTVYVAEYAKSKGKIISYDPNYRPLLWKNKDEAIEMMSLGLKYADYVKMSEEEMSLLTGVDEQDYEKGAEIIFNTGKKAVFITLGKKGAYYKCADSCGFAPTYNEVKTIDTTGCGDSFTGALLYSMLYLENMNMQDKLKLGCATGSLCSTKKGGFPAMPNLEDCIKLAFGG